RRLLVRRLLWVRRRVLRLGRRLRLIAHRKSVCARWPSVAVSKGIFKSFSDPCGVIDDRSLDVDRILKTFPRGRAFRFCSVKGGFSPDTTLGSVTGLAEPLMRARLLIGPRREMRC